jgi:two-component system invasion response regulator UvrY
MENLEKITILITEDHMLVREAWCRMFNDDPRFCVIAECTTGEEAIATSQELKPHLVMMDINLPGINGIEATREIMRLVPGSKILGVSLHAQPAYAFKMMKAGASGYITKNSPMDEMFLAVTDICNEKKYICKEVKELLSDNMISGDDEALVLNSLSKKEIRIISLIQQGYSSREIATTLMIAVKTVERHRYNIFKKLKIKNVAALVNLVNKYQHLYQFAA